MNKPKSLREQISNKCVHFNGLMNDTCKAGVNYDTVKLSKGEGRGFDIPCFKDRSVTACSCDKRQWHTEAEIQARLDEIGKSTVRTFGAIAAIQEHSGGKRGVAGELVCPACKTGKLRYSIAGVNGHIHAACTTPNCVSFMQ